MKSSIRKMCLAAACLLAGGILLVTAALWTKFSNMKAEYVTAGVISKVAVFVERTGGQWPKSWGDLGEDQSAFTVVDFSLDPSRATLEEVIAAVRPRSGRFRTYPHARDELAVVYEELCRRRQAGAAPDGGASTH
jgi:hypothetical protein